MGANRRFVILALPAALAACKLPTAPEDAQAFARQVFKQVQAGDWAALKAQMPPALAKRTADGQLDTLKAMLPPDAPDAVRLEGWRINTGTDGERIGLDHAYDFGGHTVSFHTELQRLGPGKFLLLGFNINAEAGGPPPPPPPVPRRPEPKGELTTI